MLTASKPFLSLTANDLMSRDVVLIPQETSLRAAARMLAQPGISGAPVVDQRGRCVGVLSATDFMRWAEGMPAAQEALLPAPDFCSDWQVLELLSLPADCVRSFMTADPVVVQPTATIQELCRRMVDAHIHRIVVVDALNRPIGVVSSTDILAAIARANPNH
jgi:CBS-domain-containing membrane protein